VFAPRREYDSNLGRWITEDPSELADGPNRYAYVDGSPMTMYDPTGESALIALPLLPILGAVTLPAWVVPAVILGTVVGTVAIAANIYNKNKQAEDEKANYDKFLDSLKKADQTKEKEKPQFPSPDPEGDAENIRKTKDKFDKVDRGQIDSNRKAEQKFDKWLKDLCRK
jgi:uncharacterized protein RhaS with RHS repeats